MRARKIHLGDLVRCPSGHEARVTGTMTLGPGTAGGEIKRSVCVMLPGPAWMPEEDVMLIEKAKK